MNTSSRMAARVVLAALAAGALAMSAPAARASTWPILFGHVKADPTSGPAGSMVTLKGTDFWPGWDVSVAFVDGNGAQIVGGAQADGKGRFTLTVCVPANAMRGSDSFYAESAGNRAEGSARFTVTPLAPSATSRPVIYHRLRTTDRKGRGMGSGRLAPDSICV
jgi:hypothetical protein